MEWPCGVIVNFPFVPFFQDKCTYLEILISSKAEFSQADKDFKSQLNLNAHDQIDFKLLF